MVGTKPTRSPSPRHCRTRARTSSMRCNVSMNLKHVLRPGESTALNGVDIGADGGKHTALPLHEIVRELRPLTRRDAQDVLQHQNLTVTAGTGANADDRNAQLARQPRAELGRHALDQDQV